MPFKSKAQFRKFGAMLSRGEIDKATFDEYAHSTDFSKLPETHHEDGEEPPKKSVRSYFGHKH